MRKKWLRFLKWLKYARCFMFVSKKLAFFRPWLLLWHSFTCIICFSVASIVYPYTTSCLTQNNYVQHTTRYFSVIAILPQDPLFSVHELICGQICRFCIQFHTIRFKQKQPSKVYLFTHTTAKRRNSFGREKFIPSCKDVFYRKLLNCGLWVAGTCHVIILSLVYFFLREIWKFLTKDITVMKSNLRIPPYSSELLQKFSSTIGGVAALVPLSCMTHQLDDCDWRNVCLQ